MQVGMESISLNSWVGATSLSAPVQHVTSYKNIASFSYGISLRFLRNIASFSYGISLRFLTEYRFVFLRNIASFSYGPSCAGHSHGHGHGHGHGEGAHNTPETRCTQ
eukprot:5052525-Pyramimonas_sp.AAC.1